jgi:flagellar motor switch protein FliG
MAAATATPPSALKLRGRQKAAALLISLGPEVSAEVLKHFKEAEIEALTVEIFQLEKISEEVKGQVLEECYHMALARDFITSGGMDYAREMLVRALGEERAQEVIDRLAAQRRPQRFQFARESDPSQLAQFVSNEHPQTIALILSHLQPNQAAQTLGHLPGELRTDVALRIATMDRTPPEVVEQVEDVLKRKFSSVITRDFTSVGGTQFLVNILTNVDRGTEKHILEYLDETNGELATEVRKLMFVFDDLVRLDDRSRQRVLREVDSKDLALAMRGVSEELQERIFRNQSSRAAQALREEMEIGGPVRLRQVEEAQQRIVNIVRRLDDAEEIVIQRGGEDVLV